MGKREAQIVRGAEELMKCEDFKPGSSEFHRFVVACVWSTRVWEAINGKKE